MVGCRCDLGRGLLLRAIRNVRPFSPSSGQWILIMLAECTSMKQHYQE